MTTSTDIVKLNVGGTRMETLKSTLIQLPFFESKLSRWLDSKNSNELFVDYNPVLFTHLLNKLRNHDYEFPHIAGIESMCKYFGYKNNYIFCTQALIPVYSKVGPKTKKRYSNYQINTITHKLFLISISIPDISRFHFFCAKYNDITILESGKNGLSIFFKRINSPQRIWILKECYMDQLQNFSNLTIKFIFSPGKIDYRTGIYAKTKLELNN